MAGKRLRQEQKRHCRVLDPVDLTWKVSCKCRDQLLSCYWYHLNEALLPLSKPCWFASADRTVHHFYFCKLCGYSKFMFFLYVHWVFRSAGGRKRILRGFGKGQIKFLFLSSLMSICAGQTRWDTEWSRPLLDCLVTTGTKCENPSKWGRLIQNVSANPTKLKVSRNIDRKFNIWV